MSTDAKPIFDAYEDSTGRLELKILNDGRPWYLSCITPYLDFSNSQAIYRIIWTHGQTGDKHEEKWAVNLRRWNVSKETIKREVRRTEIERGGAGRATERPLKLYFERK